MHQFVFRNFKFFYYFDIIISIISINNMMNKRFIESSCAFVAIIMFMCYLFQYLKSFMTTTFKQTHFNFNFLTFRLALFNHCVFINCFSKSLFFDQ